MFRRPITRSGKDKRRRSPTIRTTLGYRPLTLYTALGPGWCVNRRSVEIGSRGNGAKELGGFEENEEPDMKADLWRH